jgi:hypothetical protein
MTCGLNLFQAFIKWLQFIRLPLPEAKKLDVSTHPLIENWVSAIPVSHLTGRWYH